LITPDNKVTGALQTEKYDDKDHKFSGNSNN